MAPIKKGRVQKVFVNAFTVPQEETRAIMDILSGLSTLTEFSTSKGFESRFRRIVEPYEFSINTIAPGINRGQILVKEIPESSLYLAVISDGFGDDSIAYGFAGKIVAASTLTHSVCLVKNKRNSVHREYGEMFEGSFSASNIYHYSATDAESPMFLGTVLREIYSKYLK